MDLATATPARVLVAQLARLGAPLAVTVDGRITAPAGSWARPEVAPLLAEVKARKPEVLAELRALAEPSELVTLAPSGIRVPPVPCTHSLIYFDPATRSARCGDCNEPRPGAKASLRPAPEVKP